MFSRNLRIEWGDCDPAGIVFFPRYLDHFNESTIQLFEFVGLPKKRDMLREMGVAGFPMVDLKVKFIHPTSYGDDVRIETDRPEWGRSSFKINHKLFLEDALCIECWETRVWTVPDAASPGGLKAAPVPEEIRQRFA